MRMFMTLAILMATAIPFLSAEAAKPAAGQEITVYKSPTCGCCGKWEEHLKQNGFKVNSKPTEDMQTFKTQHGVSAELSSCHTGIVNGYVIEGHVPAADIKRLLAEKPKGVKGLAVPEMPMGSPGMEGPTAEKYNVLSFDDKGKTQVFATHDPAKK